VARLAVLSMHTSPLAQPGTGDGGGMNVYVRELASALARLGVACEVFTRADDPGLAATVSVEPGLRVHHIPAGPVGPVPKESLPELVPAWTAGVGARLADLEAIGCRIDAIHANYWLSGLAGHTLKHELDLPLLVTFHTLDRVKADASPEELWASEPARRAQAEAEVVGCADAVLASCSVEALQLVELYGADPDRIAIVAPGVDHAFFGPGDQAQARRAVGLEAAEPVVLFAGRIQPLKGLTVAVEAVAQVRGLGRAARGLGGTGDGRGGAGGLASGLAAGGTGVGLGAGGLASGLAAGGTGVGTVQEAAELAITQRLADALLVVIGGPSGPHGLEELNSVHRLIAERHLGQAVHMLPPQRHEMLSTFYRAADACVVPSHSESFGLVALEAAACGVPVVAAAVGGLTTLVDDGRTGFLVEGRDPADYAKPLAAILGDPALARRLGRAAARRAGAYTWRSAAHDFWARCDALTQSALVACG
jgi:D-inositol-3-phosphate glycosyltransferase